ncbi:MAG: IS110 family transposase [Ktedonobacteraceae bacterium]
MFYAGIDWSDTHHDALVIDDAGRQVNAPLRVAHSPQGMDKLHAFLESIAGPAGKENMACIVETSHGLLIAFLLEQGWPVYPVHPTTVDRRRAASGAKTDSIDAYLLAKTGRADFAELRRLTPDSDTIAELKALTRDQDALIQMQTRLVNQLTACLKAYYPVALTLFAKLQQRSTLLFLQTYPTPQKATTATPKEIAQILKQAKHPRAEKTASEIVATVHQPQLEAPEITTRTKSRLALALIAQLLPLVEQIAAYDKDIPQLFLSHADSAIFESLPRARQRRAPRGLAEIGDDRQRYADVTKVQALAGTAPVIFQSGTYTRIHRRYACVKPLRNALHQFAWQTTQTETWALVYYQRKRKEGKSHSVAVRALANVWVRVIYAMWQKSEPYQSAVFETAQQQHARRAA